jgi:hypothetical protein
MVWRCLNVGAGLGLGRWYTIKAASRLTTCKPLFHSQQWPMKRTHRPVLNKLSPRSHGLTNLADPIYYKAGLACLGWLFRLVVASPVIRHGCEGAEPAPASALSHIIAARKWLFQPIDAVLSSAWILTLNCQSMAGYVDPSFMGTLQIYCDALKIWLKVSSEITRRFLPCGWLIHRAYMTGMRPARQYRHWLATSLPSTPAKKLFPQTSNQRGVITARHFVYHSWLGLVQQVALSIMPWTAHRHTSTTSS